MTKYAVLDGINKYPSCPLKGCVNDIVNVANRLVNCYGFEKANVKMLLDERATTRNICNALIDTIQMLQSGDTLYYQHSGHGTNIPDNDDPFAVNHVDAAICPVDFDWSRQHMLTNKDFYAMFSKIPASVTFTWVSDSCHSGGLTLRDMVKQPKVASWAPRSFPKPADIEWLHTSHSCAVTKELNHSLANVQFISGCAWNQTSADLRPAGSLPGGALTIALLDTLAKAPITESVNSLVAKIDAYLSAQDIDQTPQAEGSLCNLPFLNFVG